LRKRGEEKRTSEGTKGRRRRVEMKEEEMKKEGK
jgi:hypothetical protein